MWIDTRITFFDNTTNEAILENDGTIYKDEFNGNKYPHDVIDNLKSQYIAATIENTPKELNIDYTYNAYWLPIVINLNDLITYNSNPYNHENDEIQHYNFLYENLKIHINKDIDPNNISVVIEFF